MSAPAPIPSNPPPQYTAPASPPNKTYGSTPSDPLLSNATSSTAARQAWMDQPDEGDIPDDFKYGTTVYDSDITIRHAFVRKVYSILFVQLVSTTIVSFLLHTEGGIRFVREQGQWMFWIPMIGSFGSLFAVWWKRHDHPANLILLGLFTIFESLMIGTVTSYYKQTVVLQALLITIGVFVGLTLFTMQSKYDFSSLGPLLSASLFGLIMIGLVQVFFPFGRTSDLIFSCFGVLIFSGYTMYDTHLIMKRLSPDEYIMGALSLYLDFLNLFLYILRVLNDSRRD